MAFSLQATPAVQRLLKLANSWTAIQTFINTGLHILDTNASHDLILKPGSDLTADRTLTLTTGDADRTLTMAGAATVSGTNTGDQTITLTGEVTGTGTGSFAATVAAAHGGTHAVGQGGTGAATLTGVVIGAGTGALTGVALAASQSIRRNAGDTGYESFAPGTGTVTSVTGTAPVASSGGATPAISITGAAGQVLAGSGPAFTATPTLGASGTLGSVTMGNATSGTVTLQPVAGALGTVTLSLPAATGTLVTGGGTASGANTGDQTITLTGDVTGTGTGSFATTVAGTHAGTAHHTQSHNHSAAGDGTTLAPAAITGWAIGSNVQAYDADLTTLATAFTTASAAGAASLLFAEDTDNGVNTAKLQGAALLAADITLTLPATTDTLVGRDTTDTLTNKTLTSPTLTTPALGTPASGVMTNVTGVPAAAILAGSFGAGAYVISTSLQAATIELGAATDTTLARSGAGDITIEGNAVYRAGGTDVAFADGGTGISSWTQYLIPYAATTTSIGQIAIGTSGQVLTSNGAGAAPTFQAASSGTPTAKIATNFETVGRFSTTLTGSGTIAFGGSQGADVNASSTATSAAQLAWLMGNDAIKLFAGSPIFSCNVLINSFNATAGEMFFGIGNVAVSGTAHTFTNNHIGFKIVESGAVRSVYATQANGTTETASSALTTVTVNSNYLTLILKVNSTTSVDYYWQKDGGALSSATNLTATLPTAATQYIAFSTTNAGAASTCDFIIDAASYER